MRSASDSPSVGATILGLVPASAAAAGGGGGGAGGGAAAGAGGGGAAGLSQPADIPTPSITARPKAIAPRMETSRAGVAGDARSIGRRGGRKQPSRRVCDAAPTVRLARSALAAARARRRVGD